MLKKCIFLDRDGVINVDKNYVHKVEDFDFIDGIFSFAKAAISKEYLICVITNQAGIGRGLYTEKDFEVLTCWMCHFSLKIFQLQKFIFLHITQFMV